MRKLKQLDYIHSIYYFTIVLTGFLELSSKKLCYMPRDETRKYGL